MLFKLCNKWYLYRYVYPDLPLSNRGYSIYGRIKNKIHREHEIRLKPFNFFLNIPSPIFGGCVGVKGAGVIPPYSLFYFSVLSNSKRKQQYNVSSSFIKKRTMLILLIPPFKNMLTVTKVYGISVTYFEDLKQIYNTISQLFGLFWAMFC